MTATNIQPLLTWMSKTFHTTDFSIWLKDRYDTQWRCWHPAPVPVRTDAALPARNSRRPAAFSDPAPAGTAPAAAGESKPATKPGADSSNSARRTQKPQSAPSRGEQTFSFSLELLDQSEIRVELPSSVPVLPEQQMLLEFMIRNALLQEQLVIERTHHERWLSGLRELTTSLDLNPLLFKILENSLQVIPLASRALFMMIDPETGKWAAKAQVGFKESIYKISSSIEDGITGRVYREGVGKIYNKPKNVEEIIWTLSPETLDIFEESSGYGGYAKGTIAVPVTMNTDRIGVMLVYQYNDGRLLNEGDLVKLQGYADQAAIAISNARLVSELVEKNSYLVNRSEIHQLFTRLSIDNAPLADMIKTMEKHLELPASFVDLTKSEWYPEQPGKARFSTMDLDQALDKTLAPVTLESYYIYPISSGSFLAGCFVIELKRPLRPLDFDILEQGGAVVMLQLMNTYSMTEMVYRRRRDFFEELIQYRDPLALAAKLQQFGLSGKYPLFVSLLQLNDEQLDLKGKDAAIRRLIALIEKELAGEQYLLFASHDKVTLLFETSVAWGDKRVVQKLKAAAVAGMPLLYGGVGGCYEGLEHVSKSHAEAARALSFLFKRQRADITRYEDIGINRLFLNQDTREIESFIHDILNPLRSYKYQAEELEMTLRVFMEENRSVTVTAERLHVHTNTLYVRLRKIEEILGLNLNNSEDWMKIYLACHLSDSR